MSLGLLKKPFGLNIQLKFVTRAWITTTCARAELYKSVPEQPVPIEGEVKGTLPSWLNGKLIRNGPGLFEIGDTKLKHWFDGMALLHSFTIQSGKVMYSSKFLKSNSYKKNMAANRLVISEFGTHALPDPCQTLFQRVQTYFKSLSDPSYGASDNCMVNVYPVGEKYVASTEVDFVHVFSPDTLDTKEQVQLSQHVSVNQATAHPHIDSDGTVYNLGNSAAGYNIIKMPPVEKDANVMDKASVLCTVPPKNRLKPGYSHSFGATENYFVFLEQPMVINIPNILRLKLLGKPLIVEETLTWEDKEMIRFHVIEKSTGKVVPGKFLAPPAVILHHINAYEDNGQIVVDACVHKNPEVYFTNVDVESLNSFGSDPKTWENLLVKPSRYVIPIDPALQDSSKENVVTLDYSTATAHLQDDGSIICHSESISEKAFELPRINYEKHNGKPYQFAYGINQTLTELIKADVNTKKCLSWTEEGCSVSEPVFVSSPAGTSEDDGVLLSAVLRVDESQPPFLLVLDAKTMSEVGRVEFPGIQWHKDIHGIFVPAAGQ